MSKFDPKSPKGSVPDGQLLFAMCDAIRWFKCKLKPPKNGRANLNHQGQNSRQEGKNREKYCWRFQKNRCCKWEDRCKYCDGWGHGLFNCYKKLVAKNAVNNGSSMSSGGIQTTPNNEANKNN